MSVLIEKPLSIGMDGCDALLAACKRRGVVAGVAYVHRANPVIAEMRKAIVSGEFGRPVELVAVGGQYFPLYRPAYRQTYYTRHETGGGAVQDALTHTINLGQWIAGKIDRVVADLRTRFSRVSMSKTLRISWHVTVICSPPTA